MGEWKTPKTGENGKRKSPNPIGKPAHRVTKKNKDLVYKLHAEEAKSHKFIANALNISVATLTKYYKENLDEAKASLKEEFTLSGWEMGRMAKTNPKYIPIYMFMCRTQLGFVEKKTVDNISSDGSLSGARRTILVVPTDADYEDIKPNEK